MNQLVPTRAEFEQRQRTFDNYDLRKLLDTGITAIRNQNKIDMVHVHFAYKKIFEHKMVHLDVNRNPGVKEYPNHISVSGRANCLVYLKVLSKSITQILIVYGDSDPGSLDNYQQINLNISQNCAEGLKSIVFECAQLRPITLQGFERTFNSVKFIRMVNVNLVNQLPELRR